MKYFFSLALLFVFLGCGYMPASKQARKVVGEKLFVEVSVSLQDPENAVIIKDATREAVLTRFHSSLVSKEEAETTLWVSIDNIGFSGLQYDENGYVIVYRTHVALDVVRRSKEGKKSYKSQGTFDFTIEPNAVITDVQRFEAIRDASFKALDAFIAQVGAEGVRRK